MAPLQERATSLCLILYACLFPLVSHSHDDISHNYDWYLIQHGGQTLSISEADLTHFQGKPEFYKIYLT